jgi:hypothetical protein
MREYQVLICERLGVKFPGSTRPRGHVHRRHDQEVDSAEKSVELAAKRLASKQDLGHCKAIETAAGLQQSGQ